MHSKWQSILKNRYFFASIVTVFFALLKLYYVFVFTDYTHYITSDALGYWSRAQERFDGNLFANSQWSVFPPFYHIFLAYLFKIYAFFGVFEQRLELTLLFQIALSSISIFFLYLMALKLLNSLPAAIVSMIFYGSIYTITYFNAFILSENIAIPLLIIGLSLSFSPHIRWMSLGGVILIFAVATRSNLAIVFPFILLYYFLTKESLGLFIKRSTIYIASIGVVLFFILVEYHHISGGKLRGLALNGGVNFFIALCKPKSITATGGGMVYTFGVSNYFDKENLKPFNTVIEIYNQSYFIDLGLECMKNNPNIWYEKYQDLHDLYFGNMYPTYFTAKYYKELIKLTQNGLYYISLAVLAFFYLPFVVASTIHKRLYGILLGMLITMYGVHYIFSFDHRLLYPSSFLLILIFCTILYVVFGRLQRFLYSTPKVKTISKII